MNSKKTVLLPSEAIFRAQIIVQNMRLRPWLRPDPAGGAYTASQDPLDGLRGPNSKEGEKREREGGMPHLYR